MNLAPITQENFRLLLPGKIAVIVEMRMEEDPCTAKEALLEFYHSKLYHELENEKTKWWWLSPLQLYLKWKS
ncbi:hypothetical protein ACYULU_10480 [Breznakiellaceae bacterium SP9]